MSHHMPGIPLAYPELHHPQRGILTHRSRRNRTPFVTGASLFPPGVPMLFAPCLCLGLSLMCLASGS